VTWLRLGPVEYLGAALLHGHHARSSHLAVAPVETLHPLASLQLGARLHDAPRVGQQLLDHSAEPVQLGTAGHRQVFDQLDAHAKPHKRCIRAHPSWGALRLVNAASFH
jgi:hypothetical protein